MNFQKNIAEIANDYEYFILVQKLMISAIVLFSTATAKGISLLMLIGLNVLFIIITAIFQPYLTDEELRKIQRSGREGANIIRDKKCVVCSKKYCGVNNNLDILLLTAETIVCFSAWITYNLEQTLALVGTAEVNDGNNSIASNITTETTSSDASLGDQIAKAYPAESELIGMLDYVGLILYISGFLYFLQYTFTYFKTRKSIFINFIGKIFIFALKPRLTSSKPESL